MLNKPVYVPKHVIMPHTKYSTTNFYKSKTGLMKLNSGKISAAPKNFLVHREILSTHDMYMDCKDTEEPKHNWLKSI